MFTTALEVPKDEVAIEEKIQIPTEEVTIEGPREAFIGYVMESVVKDHVTKRRVYFPLDLLTRHVVAYGVTRSGKSMLSLILIRESLANGIKSWCSTLMEASQTGSGRMTIRKYSK